MKSDGETKGYVKQQILTEAAFTTLTKKAEFPSLCYIINTYTLYEIQRNVFHVLHLTRTHGEQRYSAMDSEPQELMIVSGQPYAPASLSLGNRLQLGKPQSQSEIRREENRTLQVPNIEPIII
jgi:hypothetical protein